MYSNLQRLNHFASISTTFIMILLALISVSSFVSLPTVDVGRIDVHDLIVQRGRIRRWGAREEDLASLRFDIKTDLNPLLHSYNTKQLFVYLTATYDDDITGEAHDVVLWDRIITRGDVKDFRSVGQQLARAGKKSRGNVRVEDGRNSYAWRNPSGSFKNIPAANLTLHYSLMPYVGILSSGVAATARGPVEIPQPIKR